VSVILGFRREVDEMCALLGYYEVYSSNSLLTFGDKLSVSSSEVRKSKNSWISLLFKTEPIGTPKRSVMNYRCTLRNTSEECTSKEYLQDKNKPTKCTN